MINADIPHLRLAQQGVSRPVGTTPLQVVTALGALQAQDYSGVLWAIGLRLPGSTRAAIEADIAGGSLIRTWPMRGTLHIIPAADSRWMLQLLTPRIIASTAGRLRQLQITPDNLARAKHLATAALTGGKVLSRKDLLAVIESGGVSTAGQRGIAMLARLSQEAVLCFGPHQGKQPTFVLFNEWVTRHNEPSQDDALKMLAMRYFTSHGPATLNDFAGWSNLTLKLARKAVDSAGPALVQSTITETAYLYSLAASSATNEGSYLLPGFDEFMLGYKDRSAALAPEYSNLIVPGGNGVFLPTMVQGGQVVGTWKAVPRAKSITIQVLPFKPLSKASRTAFMVPANAYGAFMEQPVEIVWP